MSWLKTNTVMMGAEDDNQNSILKGILQNGSSFNYPGACATNANIRKIGLCTFTRNTYLWPSMIVYTSAFIKNLSVRNLSKSSSQIL